MSDNFDKYRDALGAETVDNMLAALGMGPKFVPKPPKTYECKKCGKGNAIYKEIHPDTSMNAIVLSCPDCGYVDE